MHEIIPTNVTLVTDVFVVAVVAVVALVETLLSLFVVAVVVLFIFFYLGGGSAPFVRFMKLALLRFFNSTLLWCHFNVFYYFILVVIHIHQ